MKTFSGKISPEKVIGLMMRIVLIGFALYFAYIVIMVLWYFIDNERANEKASAYLDEVCEYVKENEDIFREFYEYQRSLTRDSSAEIYIGTYFGYHESVISVESSWDMEDKRDIVFKYFHSENTGYDDEGNFYANYFGNCGYSYEITLCIAEDAAKDREEWEWGKTVNDDMYIYMLRMHE